MISFIETTTLMTTRACFYSCTKYFPLLQTFNMLKTLVSHYQNENKFLETKRLHATMIRTKLKSFTFIMTLVLTLFCALIHAVRSCDWTLSFTKGKSIMAFLLLDIAKNFSFIVAHSWFLLLCSYLFCPMQALKLILTHKKPYCPHRLFEK